VSATLGLALLVSYILRSPLIFDGFDELLHDATLMDLLDSRRLFTTNTALPVSPYYPGMELLTISVKWLTGFPLVLSQVVVLAMARLVLVLGIFLVVERVTGSARAGGIGVLVYASSPQFYSFNAQFAYQTLAIALSVAAVHLLLSEIAVPSPKATRRLALATACILGVVVTHHLTGWLTVAGLIVWAAGLRITGRSRQARTVGAAAGAGTVLAVLWTALVGGRLVGYLRPLLADATSGLASAVGTLHGNRQLFSGASGVRSPLWEVVLMLSAAVAWCVLLVPSLLAVLRQRTAGKSALRFVPAAAAACYPLTLLSSLSSSSSEVGQRASTFSFFGVALVVAGWLALCQAKGWPDLFHWLAVAVASVCFLGTMVYGSGPSWSYVPGPFMVGADQRSVGAPSIAAALWAGAHLPAGSRIAADRDNGALLAYLGHVDPVTAASGLVNVGPIYFSPTMATYPLSLVTKAQIRYLLVDDRLAQGRPLFGVYFEPGETPTPQRLTLAELEKFRSVPGLRLVYDNGPIQIYDLASVLGLPPRAPLRGANFGESGTAVDWQVLGLATCVCLLWLRRLRRRAPPPSVEQMVAFIAGTAVSGIVLGFLVVPSTLSPRLVGMVALGLVGASSWLPAARSGPVAQPSDRRRQRQSNAGILLAMLGVIVTGAGVSAAVLTARAEWAPPPELGLQYVASGRAVADVELGTAGTEAARLQVAVEDKVVYAVSLARTAGGQTVELPAGADLANADVELVVAGRVLREVQG
jgi:hypothetical protein